jgi:hypothetical protein
VTERALCKRGPHFYGGHVLGKWTGRTRTIRRLAAADEGRELELRRKPTGGMAPANPSSRASSLHGARETGKM